MKKRILTALLCFLLCITSVFAVLEPEHDCGGEYCRICSELQAHQSLVRSKPLINVTDILNSFSSLRVSISTLTFFKNVTLISLKVKFLN